MRKWIIHLILMTASITAFADDNSISSTNVAEISNHYAAQASLYQLDNITEEKISDKITRQYIMGSQSMFVKWSLKKGAMIPMHFHPNEQITWITKGSVKVISQGKEYIVKSGEILVIPPYVPHEFIALEDTIDIDYFTPVREDWLNNTASYLQKIQSK